MSSTELRRKTFPRRVAHGRFEIRKTLGAGCFGKVYRAVNTETCQEVAIKFEDTTMGADQLEHEAKMLSALRSSVQPQGFAEHYYFGKEGKCQMLVMEFLGRSLEDSVQACGGKLTSQSTVLIAEQLVQRLEYLHSRGVVHQDIKPENFVWGVKDRQHILFLIDFGLSKRYYEKKHVRMVQHSGLIGTARYASVNAHRGYEQSRRDDLEAAGHMLLYLLRGSLPWSGLLARSMEEKYRKIRDAKERIPVSQLATGFPRAFVDFLEYSRKLRFKERPNYDMLLDLFGDARAHIAKTKDVEIQDHDFEWNDGLDLGHLAPLQRCLNLRQPDDPAPPSRRSFLLCFSRPEAIGEPESMQSRPIRSACVGGA